MEVDLNVLKIKASVIESERLSHYDNVIRPLTELGNIYGYSFDKELPDGDWFWKNDQFVIGVLFDSSRGGGFPMVVWLEPEYKLDHKRYYESEHRFIDVPEEKIPDKTIETILDQVIEWMIKYRKIDMTKLLADMDKNGKYQKLDDHGEIIL